MLYGEIHLTSRSGLNELFECSIPATAEQLSFASAQYIQNSHLDSSSPESSSTEIAFARPASTKSPVIPGLLFIGLVVAVIFAFLFALQVKNEVEIQQAEKYQIQQRMREEEARRQFTQALSDHLAQNQKNHITATVSSIGDTLFLQFYNVSVKAARQNGLQPLNKDIFFKKVIDTSSEHEFCKLGFHTLFISSNNFPSSSLTLDCTKLD